MHSADLWKLSYSELAQYCQEIAQDGSRRLPLAIRDEALRIHNGWTDAASINTREEGGAERQANLMLALRKRTIELIVKTHPELTA